MWNTLENKGLRLWPDLLKKFTERTSTYCLNTLNQLYWNVILSVNWRKNVNFTKGCTKKGFRLTNNKCLKGKNNKLYYEYLLLKNFSVGLCKNEIKPEYTLIACFCYYYYYLKKLFILKERTSQQLL